MSVLREHAEMAEGRSLPLGAWISLIPSLSDLAFVTPILVLFWCTHGCGMAAHRFRHWMAHPSRGMDIEERASPCDRLFSFTKAGQPWFAWEWLSDVLMAVIHRHFSLAWNCSCEPAAPGGYVGLRLQEHTGRIWAPGDRYCADWPRDGGEHHTLARATTPRDSALRRGVLLGAQPGREKSKQRRHSSRCCRHSRYFG